MAIKAHYFLRVTAATASAHTDVDLLDLKWIANDGATSVLVNFEDDTSGTGSTGAVMTIKASEVMDIGVPVGDVYYSSSEPTVIRLFGIPRVG